MTLLITSISGSTVAEFRWRAEQAWSGGAEAVELRIDGIADDPTAIAELIMEMPRRNWIVTCRGRAEGGSSPASPTERAARLVAATAGTEAYIDFEFADWQASPEARESIAGGGPNGGAARLILSSHDFDRLPDRAADSVAHTLAADKEAVVKFAYRGRDINDSFVALDAMHDYGSRAMAICMGEAGLWTRVLAKKLGAFGTYCALSSDATTAPGQLTLDEMLHRYRWASMTAATKVYGVLGDPIAHSMSPALVNRWFAEHGIDAVHLPLRVSAEKDGLSRFLTGCVDRPWLDIGGFSVTLPHKAGALRWAGDGADRLASHIGAANTLVIGVETPRAYNTDCHAAIDSLVVALDCDRAALHGLTVDVLGAGGAACAIVAGLAEFGCSTTIYGRTADKTQRLAERFDARPSHWADRAARRGQVLINCTSLGMWPAVDESPMPDQAFDGCRLVFDLVYHPLETRLLKQASAAGCATLNGLDMFVRQAAAQFELWTGVRPDTTAARTRITEEIRRSDAATS